ncbi:hypothetical protein ES708_11911 [subsurface metagenome]
MPQALVQPRPSADSPLYTPVHPLDPDLQIHPPPVAAQPPPDPQRAIAWRHSGWRHRRELTRSAMVALDLPDKRLAAYDDCGWGGWVWQSPEDPHTYRVTANYCHDRWCLPCGATRGRTIAHTLADLIGDKHVRFVTLTLKHRDCPLADQLARLRKCLARLRRTALWRRCVTAGAVFWEIKYTGQANSGDIGWHPHVHLLVQGEYLPNKAPDRPLSKLWHRITGDSYIVDIRRPKSRAEVIHYVTKYASKPLDASVFAAPHLTEQAMRALHGWRTCTTIGSWRGTPLTRQSPDLPWISVGPLAEILSQADAGDVGAMHVVSCLPKPISLTGRPDT